MAAVAQTIPTVRGSFLVGSLAAYRKARLDLFWQVYQECGDIGEFNVGPLHIVMLNSAELAKALLVDYAYGFFEKSVVFRWMEPVIGKGLLTSEGDDHKRQRHLVTPAFQHRHLVAYGPTIVDHAEAHVSAWADSSVINIHEALHILTLQIIGEILFSVDVLATIPCVSTAMTTFNEGINARLNSFIQVPQHWPTPRNRRFQSAADALNRIVEGIIDERQQSTQLKGDLLDTLLESGMDNTRIRDEMTTLILAGHETTANALTWTCYLLAQHPWIYDKVRAEVDRVLENRTPTYDDLPQLPYTRQVFEEALRLYPPAYIFSRQSLQPLTFCGHHLPAGRIVAVSPYVLHRREDYFSDPFTFNPERFVSEHMTNYPRYAYLPFGAGPRVCIGSQLALMEGHLILAILAQRVRLALVDAHKVLPEPMITLRPRHGVMMRVHRRNS